MHPCIPLPTGSPQPTGNLLLKSSPQPSNSPSPPSFDSASTSLSPLITTPTTPRAGKRPRPSTNTNKYLHTKIRKKCNITNIDRTPTKRTNKAISPPSKRRKKDSTPITNTTTHKQPSTEKANKAKSYKQKTIQEFFADRQDLYLPTTIPNHDRKIEQATATTDIKYYNKLNNNKNKIPTKTSDKIKGKPSNEQTKKKTDKLIPIDIIYTNQQHKKAALNTLSRSLKDNLAPIITICEPYHDSQNRIPSIHKDIKIIKPDTTANQEGPRAIIGVHKNHTDSIIKMAEFDSRDTIVIMHNKHKRKTIIATIYMDGNKEISHYTNVLDKLCKTATTHNAALIINTDTNAHNTVWGDKKNDKRGEDLLVALAQNNLIIINEGNKHTFENSRLHKSVIDLTIANKEGQQQLSQWRVSNEFTNSDHKFIRAKLQILTNKYKKFKTEKNTDWQKYHNTLKKTIVNTSSLLSKTKPELDQLSLTLNAAIIKAWNKSTKTTYTSSNIKPPPWDNDQLRKQHKVTKRALKKYRKTRDQESLTELQQENRTLNKMQRKHKQEAWRKFTANIEKIQDISRINKICKNYETTYKALDTVYDKNDNITNNPTETLAIMKETHFGKEKPKEVAPILFAENKHELEFTETEVKEAILSMKPNKAPGPDSITANMLQHATDIITTPLTILLQASYDLGQTPENWKTSKGIFMPKPGKDDYKKPKAYRTITLAPVMLKIQERIIYWNLEKEGIDKKLNEKQYGFRKSSSTEAALHKIVHKIEKRMKKKQYALGVFLDVEGAFDKISFQAIQKGLINKDIPPKTINWIMNMTTTRKLKIEHKHKAITFRITKGVAQGGILSPLIWNIVLDSLLQSTAKDAPAYLQAFADDLITIAEGSDLAIIHDRTQKTLNHINDWCKTQGLGLSAIKTTMIMFTKNKKWKLKPVYIENTQIKLTDTVKFLGVTLDSKLNFNAHIDNIVKKAKKNLMRANIAIGPTWGLTPKTAIWIFRQIIRPILTYASPIWINATNTKYNQNKLRSIQRLALRIATGAFPSTAGADLNIITNTNDIIHHLEKTATESTIRLMSTNNWTKDSALINNTHAHTCKELVNELKLPQGALDKSTKNQINKKYVCSLDKTDGLKQETNDQILTIYTDGSKDENDNTGIGIYSNKYSKIIKISERLPSHATVFQAEIWAIKRAAEELLRNKTLGKVIQIRADSAAALMALNKRTANSSMVKECNQTLNQLSTHNKIELRWIKAHIGLPGNESADKLAKEGCTKALQKHNITPIPDSLIKQKTCDRAKHNTFNTFKRIGGKRLTELITNTEEWDKLTKELTYLTNKRQKFRAATQICTDIGPFKKFLYKINKAPNQVCRLCNQHTENAEHILCKCEHLSTIRLSTFGEPFINNKFQKYITSQLRKLVKLYNKAFTIIDKIEQE